MATVELLADVLWSHQSVAVRFKLAQNVYKSRLRVTGVQPVSSWMDVCKLSSSFFFTFYRNGACLWLGGRADAVRSFQEALVIAARWRQLGSVASCFRPSGWSGSGSKHINTHTLEYRKEIKCTCSMQSLDQHVHTHTSNRRSWWRQTTSQDIICNI